MEFGGRYLLAAPRVTVWAALNDTEMLRAAIPGCRRIAWSGPAALELEISVNLGVAHPVFAGDLMLTATSDLSRNRRVGLQLALGRPLPAILAELGHVAEGVSTAREVLRLSQQLGVDMPITSAVAQLLDGTTSALDLVDGLLQRGPKQESVR